MPAPRNDHLTRFATDENGCWLWTGTINQYGYGTFKMKGKCWLAHRYFYQELVGPIPAELTIDHVCWIRACVNPAHLRLLTRSENAQRQKSALRTHCLNGHELTADNVAIHSGSRRCRTCRNDAVRACRRRKRAAA